MKFTVEQLKELSSEGFNVGSHTLSHPELTGLGLAEKEREIRDSKKRLESMLGTPVEYFCYPRGLFDPASLEFVERAGYSGAVSNRPGPNVFASGKIRDERFVLRRTEISPGDSY